MLAAVLGGLSQLWEDRPGIVILLFLGGIVFIFLVADAWRHKHRHRNRK